jgi:dipeptidyl aminopeptidase/acylaminoacyl peptidase
VGRLVALAALAMLAVTAAGCFRASGESIAANTPAATPSAIFTAAPSATPTAAPTASRTPTAAPSATPTATATATPRPTREHPLMIPVMRRQSYPGSEMVIEQTLEPGENYDRYIASYLSEGNKIYGLLTRPFGPKPPTGWPVILFNHGYIPPEEYRTTERYVDYVNYFARAGYMVFRSDYRGHGESEGEAGGVYSSPNYTADVLNALAAVKTLPSADPNRIGMWGHSMGGYITLRSMVIADEIKAGVIWGGVVGEYPDLFARLPYEATLAAATAIAGGTPVPATPPPTRWPSRWRSSLMTIYGTPEENPAFWDSISSNAYLADISGPVQLHHALADDVVPVTTSILLHEQMAAAGQYSELYLYENDNHDIENNFFAAMRRSLEFFDRYVKGIGQ